MKKREWKCMKCDKVYVVESQICPKCHRVMTLATDKTKNRKLLLEGTNYGSNERM